VPAILATNYTINRFYVLGAAMWDSGWYAHLAATGLRNPPAIGGSFLSDHMSLIFVITSLIHQLTPQTSTPIFFAFTQGLWFGLLGLAASLCLRPLLPSLPAVMLSVLGAANGISLATIGFPHIEIAISALILLILACWTRGYRSIAWMLVPLLLIVREDGGLHLAIIVGLLAIWRWHLTRSWRAARSEAILAAVALLGSVASLGVQEALFEDGVDQLHQVYLGTPPLAHIDWAFLGHRIYRLGQNRSYIYVPFLVSLSMAVLRRDSLLALGALAGVPWVLLALVAYSPIAGELMSYYGFPLMVGLCWPMITAHCGVGISSHSATRLFAANVTLSVVLFAFSGGLHDRRPWESVWFPDNTLIGTTETALDEFVAGREQIGPIIVDYAVGALRPSVFDWTELRYMMGFTATEIEAVNAMIFQPSSWLAARKQEIINAATLMNHYHVRGTRLFVYSRRPLYGLSTLELVE
jgi:hypothetical protein